MQRLSSILLVLLGLAEARRSLKGRKLQVGSVGSSLVVENIFKRGSKGGKGDGEESSETPTPAIVEGIVATTTTPSPLMVPRGTPEPVTAVPVTAAPTPEPSLAPITPSPTAVSSSAELLIPSSTDTSSQIPADSPFPPPSSTTNATLRTVNTVTPNGDPVVEYSCSNPLPDNAVSVSFQTIAFEYILYAKQGVGLRGMEDIVSRIDRQTANLAAQDFIDCSFPGRRAFEVLGLSSEPVDFVKGSCEPNAAGDECYIVSGGFNVLYFYLDEASGRRLQNAQVSDNILLSSMSLFLIPAFNGFSLIQSEADLTGVLWLGFTNIGDSSSNTGSTDSGSTDTGSTGSTDTGSTDTGSTDTGSTDTGSTDTGSTDTGSTDTGSTDNGAVPLTDEERKALSQTDKNNAGAIAGTMVAVSMVILAAGYYFSTMGNPEAIKHEDPMDDSSVEEE